MDRLVYEVDTVLGNLKVYEEYCVLTAKKNWGTLLITGKYFAGEKKFYYSDLTTVQYRPAGTITDGYMEFEYPGSRSGNNSNAYSSENSFAFSKNEEAQMREIYQYIDGKIREYKHKGNAPAAPAVSAVDEILKYKNLMDMGVITEAEFEAKKKQLLGL